MEQSRMGAGIGVGLAIGVWIGVALDNIAVGIAIGVALGAGIGTLWDQQLRVRMDKDQDSETADDSSCGLGVDW